MQTEPIHRCVHKLIRHHGTRDPYRIAKERGILLLYSDMGTQSYACKGFFLQQNRILSITINHALSQDMQRIILAHELGHAVLHRTLCRGALHDFSLFTDTSKLEYEANLFAADLLVDDAQAYAVMQETDNFFSAAASLGIPAPLLDFKLRILSDTGNRCVSSPIVSHGDFLRTWNDVPNSSENDL